MTIRDIFVPVFPGLPFAPQLDVAADLALRLKAHINAVFTRPDPLFAAAAVPEMIAAAGVVADTIERDGKHAAVAAFAAFDRWRTAYGLVPDENEPAENSIAATWHERVAPVEATIAQVGRLSDLVIVVKPDPYEIVTEEAFVAAVFETGRPTLVLPPRVPQCLFHHVVIAWNGSLQAARAIDGAMPVLYHADKVSIFASLETAEAISQPLGLIEHLARHGIEAGCLKIEGTGDDVGEALLQSAAESHATMIVMGAYAHSRAREAILGGVTRHVLKHADIPVLMMH